MILSRWCCDTCFVTVWLQQGLALDNCIRCGNPWRFIREDIFDSLCKCNHPAMPEQLPLSAPAGRGVKAGVGAKRPMPIAAPISTGGDYACTEQGKGASTAEAEGGGKRNRARDERMVQLRLWHLAEDAEPGSKKRPSKVTSIDRAQSAKQKRKLKSA